MSQAQKSPHEDFIMFFFVLFILGGLGWIIWYYFHHELTNLMRWIRVGELYLVQAIYGGNTKIRHPEVGVQQVSVWIKYLKSLPVEKISWMDFKVSTYVTQLPLRRIIQGILAIITLLLLFKGPGSKYKRRMGLEGLMKEQAKSFPTIQPFLKFDPRTQPFRAPGQPVPAELPVFAEALTPEEWLAYHSIGWSNNQLDVGRAHMALTQQLGKRWQGVQKMPIHMQGLYAAFALKHVRKRKDCEQLLNEMSMAWTPTRGFKPSGKLVSQIKKIIKDPKTGGALQKYADQHGYETTALLRCLQRAREEGGVLAPAQFVWLRGFDRNLWYPLNNLGRKSYHAEAAGALVHYTNELIAGQKIPTPRFDDLIQGIIDYMKNGGARSVPELDKKASGKYRKPKK